MGAARPMPGEYEGRPEPYPYDDEPEYPDRPESPYDDPERPKLLLLVCLSSVFASSVATQ